MKLGMYVMATEPNSTAYSAKSAPSVCVSMCVCPVVARQMLSKMYPHFIAGQRFGKHVPAATKNSWRRRFLCGPCHIKGN
jgi:hypothetical protein